MSESIEIRHLRYFLAVAQTENFTRAAERLRISQPSISQQIKQLERALRVPLFRRIGKRMHLTESGVVFRSRAEIVLRKLEDASNSVNDVAGLVTGRVDLGVIPALHVGWVPAVLERMARDYAGVTVGVQESSSSGVETDLEGGRLDLGFGLMTRKSPNIRYERLVSEPFALIVSATNEFADLEAIELKQLEGVRLVLLPETFDMRRAGDDVFLRARVHPRVVFELDSVDAVLLSVVRTGMPTLLPATVIRGREALNLRAISLAGRTRQMDFGILWPAANSTNPASLALANAMKAIIKADAGKGGNGHARRRAATTPPP